MQRPIMAVTSQTNDRTRRNVESTRDDRIGAAVPPSAVMMIGLQFLQAPWMRMQRPIMAVTSHTNNRTRQYVESTRDDRIGAAVPPSVMMIVLQFF